MHATRDLNDVFDRNDAGGILRDVSADVKKFCVGREYTAALRSNHPSSTDVPTDESGCSAQSALRAGDGDKHNNVKEELRLLTHAVAANTQALARIQASWRQKVLSGQYLDCCNPSCSQEMLERKTEEAAPAAVPLNVAT